MKAEELRIGNFVNRLGALTSIRVISADHISTPLSGAVTINQIEPIPLTEECLLKLGFEKEKNIIPMYSKGELTIIPECNEYPKGRVYFHSWAIIKHTIKHVHQLQNLYYALTGEELK